ncbi:MAG: hypothetical protein AAGH41_12645 [Pseudomonadota bacterium]
MRWLGELFRRHRTYTVLMVWFAIATPMFAVLMAFDARQVDGANVWLKSVKFGGSFVTYYFALAFFARWMPPGSKDRFWQRAAVVAMVIAIVYEFVWLTAAGYLGIRSHYNYDGGLFTILYPVAGLMALILVLGALAMGTAILRGKHDAPNPAMAAAIGWGLVLVFILTPIVGFPLSNGPTNLGGSFNGYGEGLFGWRVPGGDLRAAHFLATHALHVVPLVAFLPTRIFKDALGIWLVRLIALGYAAVVLVLAINVVRGQDLPAILRMPT